MMKLKQSGSNSIHLFDGQVKKGSELTEKEKELASKAMDFQIKNDRKKIYTYNKYNKWVGGSTDDVFKDVRKLIFEISKIKSDEYLFIIILDGNYWETSISKLLEYQSHNLIISSSDDLTLEIINSKI